MQVDIGKLIWTIFLYLFIALFVGVSQAAGIGGGPIINICLIIGLGYQTKQSMAVTYIFLIGGSVASIYSNYGKKIRNGKRNMIDTNLVIMTLPMTVSGSIFGALFNHFISEFIITVAFTILLSYLAYSSFKKFMDSRNVQLSSPLLQMNQELKQIGKNQVNPVLQQILKNELVPFPKKKIIVFFQIILMTVFLLLLKGGNSFPSIIGLKPCGFGSQICVFIHFGLCFYFARSIAMDQYQTDEKKISLGYVFQKEQDKMSESYMKKAIIFGFAGGFAGGMLGIGGAIILVPAWLSMGMDNSIVSASSAPLILSSAFISAIMAFLCKYYDSFLMIIFYFALSFAASYYIKSIINEIKVKYKMQGMIYILLVLVMAMSLVFLLPYSFVKMVQHPKQFFQFGHFC